MITVAEIRKKYPEYEDLSDEQLVNGLHSKYYSDIPIEEFYGKVGFSKQTEEPKQQTPTPQEAPKPVEEPAPEMAADPEAAMMQNVETGKTDYAGELGQQAKLTARAAIRGGGALAGMFGDALNSAINLVSQGMGSDYRLPMASDTINKLADAVAVPRNEQERVIASASDAVASVISSGGIKAGVDWLISKGVNQTIATSVAQELGKNLSRQAPVAAAASAAGQQVVESTDNSKLGLAAGAAVALLGGRGAKATPKSVAVAKQEADTLYEQSKAFNLRFKPVAGKLIDKRIAAALDEQTLPLKGEGMGSVREIVRSFRKELSNPEGVSLSTFEKLRKDANNLIANAGGNSNQRNAAYVIRNNIDEFMSNVSSKMIKSGDAEGIKALVQGRNIFRTASRAGVAEDVLDRAKYLSEVTPNLSYGKALQNEIVKLVKNEKKLRANFKPDEIERLKQLSKGGKNLEMFINGVGAFAGLAGKAAALINVPNTGGLSLAAYGLAKGAQTGAKAAGTSIRERGIQTEVQRILGGSQPPQANPAVVASMFGLQDNIAP